MSKKIIKRIETPMDAPIVEVMDEKPSTSKDTLLSGDRFCPEESGSFSSIRKHLQPLYENDSLLGFAISDDVGELIYNETFLSEEAARTSCRTFLTNCKQLGKSGRRVHRLTMEMDDIVVIYCGIEEGYGLFILASECDIDLAVNLISKLKKEK